MKIKYTDPYGPTFEFDLPDGDPTLEKVLDFLNENARLICNAEHFSVMAASAGCQNLF